MALPSKVQPLESWQSDDIRDRLNHFLAPFFLRLTHSHQRLYADIYIKGRFDSQSRRTSEPIARASKVDHRQLQYFLGESRWQDRTLRDTMRDKVIAEIGSPKGILIIDASAFEKAGRHSVGVQRQYNGRLGKVDNCQLGEFIGYAANGYVTLLDCELYLPEQWLSDKERREKAHIPDDLEYRSGHELALELVKRNAESVPHCAVVGDEAYGRVDALRDGFTKIGERYLLEIPLNRQLRPLIGETWYSAEELGQKLLEEATEFKTRDGEKGPIEVRAAKCRVATKRGKRGELEVVETFVVVSNKKGTEKWHYLGTDDRTSLKEWTRIGASRTGIEYAFQVAKGEVGLDEYEVRSYVGWNHHMTLSLIAMAFLVMDQKWLKKRGYALPLASFGEYWCSYVDEFGRESSSSKTSSGPWPGPTASGKADGGGKEGGARRASKPSSRGRRLPQQPV